MKTTLLHTALKVGGKAGLPALLGVLGTVLGVVYADGFRAFCGI